MGKGRTCYSIIDLEEFLVRMKNKRKEKIVGRVPDQHHTPLSRNSHTHFRKRDVYRQRLSQYSDKRRNE